MSGGVLPSCREAVVRSFRITASFWMESMIMEFKEVE